MVQAFDLPNHYFKYLRDFMIKKYDGGIPSEEDMQLLMNVVVTQEKEYNTRSKVIKGGGPQTKPKFPVLTNIPREIPMKYTSGKGLTTPNKTYAPAHAQNVKTPILSDEVVNLPSNTALPKYFHFDIAQIFS